jgi:hypothetical protein
MEVIRTRNVGNEVLERRRNLEWKSIADALPPEAEVPGMELAECRAAAQSTFSSMGELRLDRR